MKKQLVFAALGVVGLVLVVTEGCGDDPETAPASGDGTFVVEANGTRRDVRLQNGEVFTFVFPASAAGKELTIRPVSDATVGLAGRFPNLIELLPHGTTFSPPVKVIAKPPAQGNAIITFASPTTADASELLSATAEGDAYELAHFSYLASVQMTQYCSGGTINDIQTPNTPCCPGGVDHVYQCVFPPPRCQTITPPATCVGATQQSQCVFALFQRVTNTCATADGGGDSGPTDSGTDTGGSKFDAQVGGCPEVGKYSVSATGSCGDLSTSAPEQRIDGVDCLLRFEHDSGGAKGVSSMNQNFNPSGTTQGLSVTLGTAASTCNATVAGGRQIELDCGACVVFMERTGPL